MLDILARLFKDLNKKDVTYCHWKSNNYLEKALNGETDVDLLVDPADISDFEASIRSLDFRLAIQPRWKSNPLISHHYGLDQKTGILVHLHVYRSIVTGGSILKNYKLPLKEMLFQNSHFVGPIRIPCKESELILLTIRKYLEHTSFIELYLLEKDYLNLKEQIDWLLLGADKNKIIDLLRKFLPSLDTTLFFECLEALMKRSSVMYRIRLGFKISSRFKEHMLSSRIRASFLRSLIFLNEIFRGRFLNDKRDTQLSPGGRVIAFVGPEASGKSTLVREVRDWLGGHLKVASFHCGKPPRAGLTLLPMAAIRCYVAVKRAFTHPGKMEVTTGSPDVSERHRPHPIVSLIDAYERQALVRRAFGLASRGFIVIADRYPSRDHGNIDGPQIIPRNGLGKVLARLEHRLYQRISPPDLVIKLDVPFSLTQERNAKRERPEPEDYLRMRYEKFKNLDFKNTFIQVIDNSKPLEYTLLEVRKVIWERMALRQPAS